MRRAEERTLQINDGFPVSLFMVYVLYYAGQAVYNTISYWHDGEWKNYEYQAVE